MEIWKTINDTDNKYAVSNLGNVKRLEHYTMVGPNKIHYGERILKQYVNKEGYCIVHIVVNGKTCAKKVHRLVAQCFLENPKGLPQVNHIDEDRQNNNVENLEWCSPKQNSNHGTRNDKLRKVSGIKIAQYSLSGDLIKIWDSISQASQYLKCSSTCCIRRVCKGQRKSYKGFVWKYVDSKIIGDSTLKQQMLNDKNMILDLLFNTFSKDELLFISKELQNRICSYKTAGEK